MNRNGNAKLTIEQVKYVLTTRPRIDKAKDIARELGVGVTAIHKIRQGKSWSNIEKEEISGAKRCTACKEIKVFSDYPNGPSGVRSTCKACHNKWQGKWRKNTDKGKEYMRRNSKRPGARYSFGKNAAKKRGLDFTISIEEFTELISQGKCHYCNDGISIYGVGLDRKDNDLGYIKGNVVPCCTECNKVKNNIFTYREMIELGKVIKIIKENRLMMAIGVEDA